MRKVVIGLSILLCVAALASLFAYAAFDWSWWAPLVRDGDPRNFMRGTLLMIFHALAIAQSFLVYVLLS